MITYLDACPSCPPGIPDASPAIGEPEEVSGGTVTDHHCGTCKTAWSTLWRDGWPVDRLTAETAAEDRRAA